jgi:hypothetical protein
MDLGGGQSSRNLHGVFIGWAGLKKENNVNDDKSFIDLGYRLLSKYWGQGYATEACQGLVAYGFKVLKLEKIYAYCEYPPIVEYTDDTFICNLPISVTPHTEYEPVK